MHRLTSLIRLPSLRALVSAGVVGTLVLGGLLTIGALRRWDDRGHCWGWTPGKQLSADGRALPMSEQPESFRRAAEDCVHQRRALRGGLLSGFSTRDRAEMSCSRRWSGLVELVPSNPDAESFIPESYGTSAVDVTNPADRERFLDACIPVRTRQLRDVGGD